jgi:hypothetical protein
MIEKKEKANINKTLIDQCLNGREVKIKQLNDLLMERLQLIRDCISDNRSNANTLSIDRTTVIN